MVGYSGNDASQYGLSGVATVAENHGVPGRRNPWRMGADQVESSASDRGVEIAAQAFDRQPVKLCVECGEMRRSGRDVGRHGTHAVAGEMQRNDAAAAAQIKGVAALG